VPQPATWGADIWFGDPSANRDEFVASELEVLLGEPSVPLLAAGPIEVSGGGLSYRNPLGERVPLEVRLPGGSQWSGTSPLPTSAPVMIALHQTNEVGGREPCGEESSGTMAYGTYFARRGYVVVCPTLSFTGTRQPTDTWDTTDLYAAYPSWSAMGKDVSEVSWLIDSLSQLDDRIDDVAVVGHSQGAIYALYSAAADERIGTVVANAGYADTDLDPITDRWARAGWYRAFRSWPTGLDQLEVVAAIAPRCALLINYDRDDILIATEPSPDRLRAFQQLFPTITWMRIHGEHDWPVPQQALAAEWLDGGRRTCTST
jgi:pimeloyl-ACP methyl ester carboxylesterase